MQCNPNDVMHRFVKQSSSRGLPTVGCQVQIVYQCAMKVVCVVCYLLCDKVWYNMIQCNTLIQSNKIHCTVKRPTLYVVSPVLHQVHNMLPPIHMYITAPSESLPIYGWNWQNCTRILWKYDQNLAEATILNCHLANKHVSVFSLNIVMFLQPNGFGLVLWIWLCFWTTNMTKKNSFEYFFVFSRGCF